MAEAKAKQVGLTITPESELPASMRVADKRRVRVLFIIDSLWNVGGAELALMRLVQGLPADQFECRVLTFLSDDKGRLLRERFGCPVDHWPLDSIYGRNARRVAKRLYDLVRDEHIDIVHTFFQTSDLWAAPIAKLAGARVLVSSRRDMGILREFKHRLGYRLMGGIFDQIHAVSEGVRQYTIQSDKVNPLRTMTVHNGIDPDFLVSEQDVKELRQTLELPATMPIVTTVANFRAVKGIDVLIRAAAQVARDFPEVRFLVVGGFGQGPKDRAFTNEVLELNESLGTSQWVRFLGLSDQVSKMLALSDIFVCPSRSEGFSNALLEAMRAGLPCVATSVGGNPEVVVDGVTGYLVPSENPEELADRMLRLLRDPALRHRMGMAGRQRVLSEFTTGTMVANVTAAYRELLQAKGLQTPSVCGDC